MNFTKLRNPHRVGWRVIAILAFSWVGTSIATSAGAAAPASGQEAATRSLVEHVLKTRVGASLPRGSKARGSDVSGPAHFKATHPPGRVMVRLRSGSDPQLFTSSLGSAGASTTVLR